MKNLSAYPIVNLERDIPQHILLECHTYKVLDKDSKLVKQFEKDDYGTWHDVTEREMAKIELEKAKKELSKLEE